MNKNKKTSKVVDENLEVEHDESSSMESLTAEDVYKKYTVAELRDILKENGLSVSGKKMDLVERVLPVLNDDSIEDIIPSDVVKYPFTVEDDSVTSSLGIFGINYDDLVIKDKVVDGKNTSLTVQGLTQKGISMSDSTISVATDPSNVDLKVNVPEVSYSNFESNIFTLKNLDLSVLPSSNPNSLELSACMDSLELISAKNYVNLSDLNLFSKVLPDESGLLLDIGIKKFLYPNYDNTSFNFENLDFNLAIGLDGQSLDISVNLPTLSLINKDYKVNLSDLKLNIRLNSLKLSDLDISIFMSDFHYTNFDDVHVDMDNVNVSLEPIFNLNSFDVNIQMNSFDAAGVTFDEMFPMLNIDTIKLNNSDDDMILPISLTGHISPLDVYQMDLSSIASLLSSGFDLDTYMRNMPDYEGYIEVNVADTSGLDLNTMFKNFDSSSLDGIVLNLSGIIDSTGIDLSDFNIDVTGYDLSAIKMSDLMDILSKSDINLSTVTSIYNLFTSNSDDPEKTGIKVSFDSDKFDISSLLGSLNITGLDISGILDMINNSDLDLEKIFKNCDISSLDGIKLNLTGLIDSLGIDLSKLGIDLSKYDLSAIRLSEIVGILNNFDLDMSSLSEMLKLSEIDVEKLDLSKLLAGFDTEKFDISGLLDSLNLALDDIIVILDMINNSDLDFESIFKNFDYSCLDAITLDLSGLIDSLGIDLSDLGIDLGDYDLSSIKLSDLMDILNKAEFDMESISSILKVFNLDVDKLDMSGLIAKFDTEEFDLSSLLASLNLSDVDIPAILKEYEKSDIDFDKIFANCDYSSLDGIELDLTGLIESAGIDLSESGIEESDYDLSAIKVPELIDLLNNADYDMSEFDLTSLEMDKIDMSGLIAGFDTENFDISPLLASLNISKEDISGILELINNPELDLGSIFKDCDYSCLDAIVLDISGLIDSTGIDLSKLGIDLSDYDLSAISVSDLIDFINKSEFNMESILALLKLIGIDVKDLDLSGLIAIFDTDNFDISQILAGLNLSKEDISAILDIFNSPDLDLDAIFKNCDYSCLGAITLDISEFIDSTGIDLSELGIDVSGYDLSAISLSDIIDICNKYELKMSTITALLKLFNIDIGDIDLSGLIVNFDEDNFDISKLLAGLNISTEDLSGILALFNNPDLDLEKIFEKCDYSCLGAVVFDLSGVLDSPDIDLSKLDIDVSGYDLSAISLSDIIDVIIKSKFINSLVSAISKLSCMDWEKFDTSELIVSYDSDKVDINALLSSINIPGVDISGTLDTFSKNGFDLSELLNQILGMFMQKN